MHIYTHTYVPTYNMHSLVPQSGHTYISVLVYIHRYVCMYVYVYSHTCFADCLYWLYSVQGSYCITMYVHVTFVHVSVSP